MTKSSQAHTASAKEKLLSIMEREERRMMEEFTRGKEGLRVEIENADKEQSKRARKLLAEMGQAQKEFAKKVSTLRLAVKKDRAPFGRKAP